MGKERGSLALRELVSYTFFLPTYVFAQEEDEEKRRRNRTMSLVFQILSFLVPFKFFVHSLNSVGLRDCYSRSKKVGGSIYIRELRSSQGEGKGMEGN